jgi:hypothetical protein
MKSSPKEGGDSFIPEEVIMCKIILIRGQKVMISNDLAELYGVSTKRLNEQVKRNIKRFPHHFMLQLTKQEKHKVVANCDHLQNLKYSPYLPYAFTEHGTVMLANILNSDRAIQVSIRIVEIYIKMREYILTNKDLLLKMEQLEKRVGNQDEKIVLVFNYLKRFIEVQEKPRIRIGFKPND